PTSTATAPWRERSRCTTSTPRSSTSSASTTSASPSASAAATCASPTSTARWCARSLRESRRPPGRGRRDGPGRRGPPLRGGRLVAEPGPRDRDRARQGGVGAGGDDHREDRGPELVLPGVLPPEP